MIPKLNELFPIFLVNLFQSLKVHKYFIIKKEPNINIYNGLRYLNMFKGGVRIVVSKGRRKIAENIACKYLKDNNYIIVEKNFECKKEIVDLIAYDELTKELVFIKLKIYIIPKELKEKEIVKNQEILRSIAKYYNYEYGIYDIPVRFDIIKILLNNSICKIKHIKRIFNK